MQYSNTEFSSPVGFNLNLPPSPFCSQNQPSANSVASRNIFGNQTYHTLTPLSYNPNSSARSHFSELADGTQSHDQQQSLSSDTQPASSTTRPNPSNFSAESPVDKINQLVSKANIRYTGNNQLQPMLRIPQQHSPQLDQWSKCLIKIIGTHLLSEL
jgi:hypothetical protein